VRTLILGCGYLGRRVGLALSRRGETVYGTVRTETSAEFLPAWGVDPVLADVLDPASLARLPAADRVVYAVGFDRAAGVPMRTVYVDGLRTALAALGPSTRRVVYAGATSVYGGNDGGLVDEETPAEPVTESGRVCLDAEAAAAEVCASKGIELVIVRYSGLYGPGRVLRRAALERGDPIAGDPLKYLNLIQIEDAAAAAVLALDRGIPGRIYLATDDRPLPRRDYYRRAAALLHAPEPTFLPPAPDSPESRRDKADKRVSNRRIKSELGLELTYPDIDTGLPTSIAGDGLLPPA